MKKYLLILFTVLSTVASAQNNDLEKSIDLNISQIEAMIKMSGLRMELSTDTKEKFDEKDAFNFEDKGIEPAKNSAALQKHFDSLQINTTILHPYNVLNIRTEESDLLQLMGKDHFYFMKHSDMNPVYTPKSVVYLDGKKDANPEFITEESIIQKYSKTETDNGDPYSIVDTAKATDIEKYFWSERSGFSSTAIFKSPKPIQSITYQIDLPMQKTHIYYAEKANEKVKTSFGDITVVGINGNTVVLRFPQALDDQIQVHALYKDGRRLRSKGSSKFTIIDDNKIKAYKELIVQLRAAKKLVAQGKLKTEDVLGDFLKDKLPAEITENNTDFTEAKYVFSGPISNLAFAVTDTAVTHQQFTTTYNFLYREDEREYLVAGDFETKKTGIIDAAGHWIAPPAFDNYFRRVNKFFFRDQIDDKDDTYWFDPSTKKLQKVNYLIDDYEIYNGRCVKIEPRINGKRGIVDGVTGKIVLPMEYEYISHEDNKVWTARKHDMRGAFDKDLKIIMPFVFERLRYENGFFYTEKNNIEDVYDIAGNNITQGKYNSIEYTFEDGRLLVRTYDQDEDHYTTNIKYYFIDAQGKVVTDLTAKGYSEAKIYRNGLAAVKCKDSQLWGFIDINGKSVLPCNYSSVSFGFYPKSGYAPVHLKDGPYALIDKKGKVIKKFNSSFEVVSFSEEKGDHQLRVDGVWYDEFGKEVKEQK